MRDFDMLFRIILICTGWLLVATKAANGGCIQEVNCRRPNCVCPSAEPPMGIPSRDLPQIVYFTFDDAVTHFTSRAFNTLFPPERKNPNGCPIPMTLFISHASTDYGLVRAFYERGVELAVHSVRHKHIRSDEDMLYEAVQQRKNIATQAKVPIKDITGWRSPFLLPYGDKQMEILKNNGFQYDSTLTIDRGGLGGKTFWPLTMDYGWPYSCMVIPCPRSNFTGFWEVPIVSVIDYQKAFPCQYIDGCVQPPPDEEAAFQYLWQNFESYYRQNRAPFGINMHAAWFAWPERLAGMNRFIQKLVTLDDVYITTVQQLLEYVKKPFKLQEAKTAKAFQCRKQNNFLSSGGAVTKPNLGYSRTTKRYTTKKPRSTTVKWKAPRTTTQRTTLRRTVRTTTPTTRKTTRYVPRTTTRRTTTRATKRTTPVRTTTRATTTRKPITHRTTTLKTTLRPWTTTVPVDDTKYKSATPWWNLVKDPATGKPWWQMTIPPVVVTSYPWWDSRRHHRPTTVTTPRYVKRRTTKSWWGRTTTTTMRPHKTTELSSWTHWTRHSLPNEKQYYLRDSQNRNDKSLSKGASVDQSLVNADKDSKCRQGTNCFLPNCFCDGKQVPQTVSLEQTPQMVYITFEGPINPQIYVEFVRIFSSRRRNPNGCPIKATFYIPGSTTDAGYTKTLYERGNEISLLAHRGDPIRQRDLLAVRTDIPKTDIKGWRSENLTPLHEAYYDSLKNNGFAYDSTLIGTRERKGEQLWPLTLDFGWTRECNIKPCPTKPHPGLWEIPVVGSYDIKDLYPCTYMDGCHMQPHTTNDTYQLLWDNFQAYYSTNRAPFAINLRHTWFHYFYHFKLEALNKFIEKLVEMENVYIVTISEMLDWIKDPVPLNELQNFQSWQCF